MDDLAKLREFPHHTEDDGYVWHSELKSNLVKWLQNEPKTPRVRRWLLDLLTDINAASSIAGILEDNPSDLRDLIGSVESPLELATACWLCNEIHYYNKSRFGNFAAFSVVAQQQITVSSTRYRVDFMIRVESRRNREMASLVALECDGHDFHEKTKEQATRDKERDRWIQGAGIPILRFTGSELWEGRTSSTSQALVMCYNMFAKAHGLPTIYEALLD